MNKYVSQRSSTPPPSYINQQPSNFDALRPLSVNNFFTNSTQPYNYAQAQEQDQHAPPSYLSIINPLNHNRVSQESTRSSSPKLKKHLINIFNRFLSRKTLHIWSIVNMVFSLCPACICL
jgi:hypothetical protein